MISPFEPDDPLVSEQQRLLLPCTYSHISAQISQIACQMRYGHFSS